MNKNNNALLFNKPRHSWREAFSVYLKPRILGMFFLGFSAGLPFLLVFSTLTAWLRDEGVSKSMIGFFAWVGLSYSIKFVWAPIIDRINLPLLESRLGHRRSWMLVAMLGIAAGLFFLSTLSPRESLTLVALVAVWIAFSSATQDIVIDAYRIEAVKSEYQAAMAGAYQAGWRVGASLVGSAVALYLAELYSWHLAYVVMGGFVLVGIVTVLLISEPERVITHKTLENEQRVVDYLNNHHKPNRLVAWCIGAIVCPFADFFQRNGKMAIGILLFIGLYRISDITLAIMANPFYLDMGFSKIEIANVTKIYGLFMTLAGALLGGIMVVRYNIMRPMLLGAVMVAVTNLLFATMVSKGHDLTWFTIIVSADNFSGGFASSAFIAYLSSLTNTAYTATQYALFSSIMILPAKIISGFSGIIVDSAGYTYFFTYTASLGIPAILMVLWLILRSQKNTS
ncbi:AmpG family muropeptide MFS transporter [Beggiatoa alba]|nr:AmpG family muropeptide MFS transporter [Beggiatoa alba]